MAHTKQTRSSTQDAITNGASSRSEIDDTKDLPAMGNGGALEHAVDVDSIADELATGEFVKKAELCEMGAFNLVGATKRMNEFKGKRTEQVVFEVQFLEGENRGARALVSMDLNFVREKYYNAVKKHGGVGPLVLVKKEADSPQSNEAYIFQRANAPSSNLPF